MRQLLDQGVQALYQTCVARDCFPGTVPTEVNGRTSTIAILESLGIMKISAEDLEEEYFPNSQAASNILPSPVSEPHRPTSPFSVQRSSDWDGDSDRSTAPTSPAPSHKPSKLHIPSFSGQDQDYLNSAPPTLPYGEGRLRRQSETLRRQSTSAGGPSMQEQFQSATKRRNPGPTFAGSGMSGATFQPTRVLSPTQTGVGSHAGPILEPHIPQTLSSANESFFDHYVTRPSPLYANISRPQSLKLPNAVPQFHPPSGPYTPSHTPVMDPHPSQWQSFFDFSMCPDESGLEPSQPYQAPLNQHYDNPTAAWQAMQIPYHAVSMASNMRSQQRQEGMA